MSLMMACLFGVVVTIIVTWIAAQSTQSKGPEVHRMKRDAVRIDPPKVPGRSWIEP